jgi:hypothetical protein
MSLAFWEWATTTNSLAVYIWLNIEAYFLNMEVVAFQKRMAHQTRENSSALTIYVRHVRDKHFCKANDFIGLRIGKILP